MFDTIFIGKDLRSLISAIAVTYRGGKALLIGDGDTPDIYAASGCTFNIDPFPWTGLGNSESLINRLIPPIVLQTLEPCLVPLNPAMQIILPDHRLDIFNSRHVSLLEMIREFPTREAVLKTFHDVVYRAESSLNELISIFPTMRPGALKNYPRFLKLLARYRREKSRGERLIRGFRRDDSLRSFIGVHLAVLSHLHPADVKYSPLWPYALTQPCRGFFYPVGGKKAVLNILEDLFVRQGGVLFDKGAVKGISRLNGLYRVEGLDGDEKFNATTVHLIVSTAWKDINILHHADPRRARRFESILRRSEVSAYPFTLHMSISDRGIPEKLSEYSVLVRDPGLPLHGLNLIFLELSMIGDETRAPTGKRALSATVFLTESPAESGEDHLSELADKIIEELEFFLPFLTENIEFLDKARCIELFRSCGETTSLRYRIAGRSFLRLSSLSLKTPFHNVYLNGKDIYAGLGFQGELLSGLNAASLCKGGQL